MIKKGSKNKLQVHFMFKKLLLVLFLVKESSINWVKVSTQILRSIVVVRKVLFRLMYG